MLRGGGIRSHENGKEGVGARAQHVGRALEGSGETPVPRHGGGPSWAKWWERPRSSEVLFTEKQGSESHGDRAERQAAVEGSVGLGNLRAAWDTQAAKFMGPES